MELYLLVRIQFCCSFDWRVVFFLSELFKLNFALPRLDNRFRLPGLCNLARLKAKSRFNRFRKFLPRRTKFALVGRRPISHGHADVSNYPYRNYRTGL